MAGKVPPQFQKKSGSSKKAAPAKGKAPAKKGSMPFPFQKKGGSY